MYMVDRKSFVLMIGCSDLTSHKVNSDRELTDHYSGTPIANKYHEGNLQGTLKREFNSS